MSLRFLIPGLPLFLRLLIFYCIEAAGLFIQLYIGRFLPGTIIMIGGLFFVFAKNYSNKPADTGLEDWLPVSFDEFTRIETNLSNMKTVKYPRLYRLRFGCIVNVVLVILAVLSMFFIGNTVFLLVLFDILIVTFPLFYSGIVKLWTPKELKLKLEGFHAIMEEAMSSGPDIVLTPYLRFDKDKEGKLIPEDIRFMGELRRNPEDLLGVQFQTAVNNGPNGQVPYMYAVFICKGKGSSFTALKGLTFGGFLKEATPKEDYSTLVIRQKTESGGYHTKIDDCITLYRTAIEALRRVK